MKTKLTLSLNNDTVERAKEYAHNHKISLSRMVELYLEDITKQRDTTSITPLVESLSGVISLPNDFDYKKRESRIH